MSEIDEFRHELDSIDAQLCELLKRRMAVSDKIALYKRDHSLNIRDEEREAFILNRVQELCGGEAYAAEIFRTVLRCSRQRQESEPGISAPMVIDISRELFSSPVYPDDPGPSAVLFRSIAKGSECNLTKIELCVHNGTHIDSPLHFIDGAGDILTVPADAVAGRCLVADFGRDADASDIASLPQGTQRLLLRGFGLTPDGAKAAVKKGIMLTGVECNSVGDAEVHRILLSAGVVPLECLCLDHVKDGEYFLFALPLKLAGCEGAPCRAILIKE